MNYQKTDETSRTPILASVTLLDRCSFATETIIYLLVLMLKFALLNMLRTIEHFRPPGHEIVSKRHYIMKKIHFQALKAAFKKGH